MTAFLLERGADPAARDAKVNGLPEGWAEYGGHPEFGTHLARIRMAGGS